MESKCRGQTPSGCSSGQRGLPCTAAHAQWCSPALPLVQPRFVLRPGPVPPGAGHWPGCWDSWAAACCGLCCRFQRNVLDLSLQWRFANLPNNAKLEMVPAARSRVGPENTVGAWVRWQCCSWPFPAGLGLREASLARRPGLGRVRPKTKPALGQAEPLSALAIGTKLRSWC